MFENRRTDLRVRYEVTVSVSSASTFWMGLTEDLAEGGLFIATPNLLPIGDRVKITLALDDGGPATVVDCEVRWQREADDERVGARAGMGVMFVDLEPAVSARIQAFCRARREAMFVDLDD